MKPSYPTLGVDVGPTSESLVTGGTAIARALVTKYWIWGIGGLAVIGIMYVLLKGK